MGHFARHTEIPKDKWTAALKKVVKPQFIDMNLKAFDLGYNS
jgi:indolepyruvate ferredoxin oxidoreductase beta subunit